MLSFLTLGTTLTFIDQAIKSKVESGDADTFPRELPGTKGLIWLYKNHNEGFSFGALRDHPKLVERVPLCVLSGTAGVWLCLLTQKGKYLRKLALTLTLAGGASNLWDRIGRGYVVDYFSIRFQGLKKVVMNLGDVCIFLGAVFMLAAGIQEAVCGAMKRKKKKS